MYEFDKFLAMVNESYTDDTLDDVFVDYDLDPAQESMHYDVKNMKCDVRKSKKATNQQRGKYDPPYSAKQVKEKYGDEIFKKLRKDPAHKWRMDTGIELIHKEPTLRELLRIRRNWSLMSEEQKILSDRKSIELFGMTNIEHFNSLLPDYDHGNAIYNS